MTGYTSAYGRWAGLGPYYAMFPLAFVNQVVHEHTEPGQSILDPFAGRASTVFAGAVHGRPAIGIEINPVGWVYGQAKLHPAPQEAVLARLEALGQLSQAVPEAEVNALPEFFRHCFGPAPLRFLLAARRHLNWRRNRADQTTMALILVDLHGNLNRSFSNQMRQGRAMEPNYSIAWWQARQMSPPDFDPVAFMRRKVAWRYQRGLPTGVASHLFLGDSQQLMAQVAQKVHQGFPAFSLLFTSPPYIGLSDYHRDQWLRRWMLGGPPDYSRLTDPRRRDFASEPFFRSLLTRVFAQAAPLMRPDGCVYVRTDARPQTFNATWEVVQACFPGWRAHIVEQPYVRQTQTALYGDKQPKPGERDIILLGPENPR